MRHLQKSGIITLKALGSPIGSRTAQVQEQQLEETKFIAFFMGKKIDIEGKDLYDAKQKAITQLKVPKSKVGLLAVVSAESQKNQDFRFESVNEEVVNEGKKAFKINPGIGSSKYSISSHDGVKKHKDGSDFYDIEIFKNKVDLEKGIKDYKSKGFVEESVNEAKVIDIIDRFEDLKLPNIVYLNKKVLNLLLQGLLTHIFSKKIRFKKINCFL